jgi:hypothetical protein
MRPNEYEFELPTKSPSLTASAGPGPTLPEDEAIPSIRNEPSLRSIFTFDRLDALTSWKKSFITHCQPPVEIFAQLFMCTNLLQVSANIAPHMLAIDDSSNGWRQLILPIAIEDEVVMDAVIAASAYHVSSRSHTAISLGQSYFTKTVHGLLKRQDFKSLDPMINGFSVVAILVLLVTSMITGCSDFPILFGMLKSAFKAMKDAGGCGDERLDDFLQSQFRK